MFEESMMPIPSTTLFLPSKNTTDGTVVGAKKGVSSVTWILYHLISDIVEKALFKVKYSLQCYWLTIIALLILG